MAGKEANELTTIPSIAAGDYVVIYDSSEVADEKLKKMAYSDFSDPFATTAELSDYVPWDFGSGTISGTGDIYCNDVYTSTGTEGYMYYVGADGKLTTTPNMTYVDGDGVDFAEHMALGNTADVDIPGFPEYGMVLRMGDTFAADSGVTRAYGHYIAVNSAVSSGTAYTYGSFTQIANSDSTEHAGIYGSQIVAMTSNNSGAIVDEVMGIKSMAAVIGDNTTVATAIGGDFTIGTGYSMSNSSITNAIAGQFQLLPYGSGGLSIINGYGALIKTPGINPAGTTTNLYGLYIEDQSTVGFTTDYNLYSAGASSKNKFEGDIEFGGTISGTGDIYCNDIYTSSGTVNLGDLKLSSSGGDTLLIDDVSLDDIIAAGAGTSDKIEEGNSSIEVIDTGTGSIELKADGFDIMQWSAQGTLVGGTDGLFAKMVHDAGSLFIYNQYVNDNAQIILQGIDSESSINTMGRFYAGGAVELYYSGSQRFATLANGIEISDGTRLADLRIQDNEGQYDFIIRNLTNDGELQLFTRYSGGDRAVFTGRPNGHSNLYYAGNSVAATQNAGFHVTGSTGLKLATGGSVNEIETTLTDDDTHLPTSGAVKGYVDSVSGTLSEPDALYYSGDPHITAKSDGVEIEGPSGQLLHLDAATGTFNVETQDSIHLRLAAGSYTGFRCYASSGMVWLYYGNTKEGETVSGAWKATNGFQIASSPIVNDIETTLTDDDTHLPTSGAVVDHVAATVSGVNGWFDDGTNFRCTVTNGLITNIGATVGAGYNVS